MKGNELKPRIGIFGRSNVGKSTLINSLTGQPIAIVSPTAGTTTDPVRKSIELGGIGAVVLVDTAGIDDVATPLGRQRVAKSMAELDSVDLAIVLYTHWGDAEQQLVDHCTQHHIPLLKVQGKADVVPTDTTADCHFSANNPTAAEALISAIRQALPEHAYQRPTMLADVVQQGDTVVLVTPIDSSAPEGRMILPQVQVLREIMDIHARAIVCQPQELPATLDMLQHSMPKLVITDSQAFQQVAQVVPEGVYLTSFSVVLARQKGLFHHYLQGTQAIAHLRDADEVLLIESCTHNITCEDIGRYKLPRTLLKATGKQLLFTTIGGTSPTLPQDKRLSDYALVIQCGGCVATPKQLRTLIEPAIAAHIPVSNYGLALAYCANIFQRSIKIFQT